MGFLHVLKMGNISNFWLDYKKKTLKEAPYKDIQQEKFYL